MILLISKNSFQKKLQDFIPKFLDEFDSEGTSSNFEKLFKNTPETRRLLFGRRKLKRESLFETILSNKSFCYLIKYIWNEFKLWEKPEVLSLVSLSKKLIFFKFFFGNIWIRVDTKVPLTRFCL